MLGEDESWERILLPFLVAMSSIDQVGIQIALTQARKSFNEGGIPIGCSLLSVNGAILGAGHNQRIQKSSPTLHGEIAALEDAGRLKAGMYRDATMVSCLLHVQDH